MQNYNFIFFLSGNLTEIEVPESLEKVKTLVEANGGTEISFENAGRQKMAYATGDHRFAYLINASFKIDQANLSALKEKLTFEKEILRFMINRVDSDKAWPALNTLTVISPTSREVRPTSKKEEAPVEAVMAKTAPVVAETVVEEPVKEEKEVEVKEDKKKAKMDLSDINKKIDEILQQDNFMV